MFPAALLLAALAADPTPRLDADGIPLPTEALRRFGSLRWYADPPRSVAFSPDGKVAYLVPGKVNEYTPCDRPPAVTAWEYPSGRPLWQFDDFPLTGFSVAADPDGKTVWLTGVIGLPSNSREFTQPFVRVKLDAATGKELARVKLRRGWSPAHALRPDGTLAWNRFDIQPGAKEGDLTLRILKPDGTEQATWEGESEQGIDLILYSPDGKTLYVSGPLEAKFKSRLAAVDATTGKTKWAVTCPEIDSLAVSPDGTTLAAVTASSKLPTPPGRRDGWPEEDATYLAKFDAATGETNISLQIGKYRRKGFREDRPYFGRPIRFSPDGKTLLVMDDDRKTLPIDPREWLKGKEEVDTTAFGWLTPDGKNYLAPTKHQTVAVFDAKTRDPLPLMPPIQWRTTWWAGNGVSFSADGKRVRFGEAEFDTTGKEVARVSWEERRKQSRTGVAELNSGRGGVSLISPDGKFTFRQYGYDARSGKEKKPELLDTKSGESVTKFDWPTDLDLIAFSPDSKKLIGMECGGDVYLWDLTTVGKPLLESRLNKAGGGGGEPILRVSDKWAVVAEPNWGFNYWDPARRWSFSRFPFDGFKREKTWRGQGAIRDLTITPGGGFAGWAELPNKEYRTIPAKRWLFVIDPGADVPKEYPLAFGTGFAVSPDGRTAAFGVGSGAIELYEVATGQRRHTFVGLKRPAQSLAFNPDGKALASESADGPVILWDVKGELTKPAKPDAAGWDAAWKQLVGDDAEKAFAAVRLFAAHPDAGADELKTRFAGVKSPEVVACERAVEALQWADGDSATRLVGEWAKGPDASALTKAAKRR